MNKEIAKAVDMLKSVLCDAEGRASISGTNEDRAEIDEALSILSSAHVVDAEPVAEQYLPVATVFAGRKDGGGWQNRAFCLQEIFGEEQAKIGLQDVKVGSVLYAKEENLTTAAPSNTATVQIDENGKSYMACQAYRYSIPRPPTNRANVDALTLPEVKNSSEIHDFERGECNALFQAFRLLVAYAATQMPDSEFYAPEFLALPQDVIDAVCAERDKLEQARAIPESVPVTSEFADRLIGLEVSVVMDTSDDPKGHRIFGKVSEVMENMGNLVLLVQSPTPNYTTPQPSAPAYDPAKWQLVPKEPTEAMLYEAHGVREIEGDWRDFDKNSAATYAAMLQAAPQAQDTEVKK